MPDKKELKKLTFDELIAKKMERDKSAIKFKEIEVPSYGGTLVFEKPLEEDILDCMDKIDNEKPMSSSVAAYDILIYNCCPTLKDTKLQEQLGVKDPKDIVKELLDVDDRLEIGNELVEFSGVKIPGAAIKK